MTQQHLPGGWEAPGRCYPAQFIEAGIFSKGSPHGLNPEPWGSPVHMKII